MNYSLERQPMAGMLGETKPDYLVSYGIQNEKSDIRVHVCVVAQIAYAYPTACGVAAMLSGKYVGKPGYQRGYDKPTSWGYLVPPNEISRCVPISIKSILHIFDFNEKDSTSVKGDKATRLVARLLQIGWFPLPVDPKIIEDTDMQISGTDINVQAGFRIQVKCDYRGGIGQGCTGNLYLQTAEINPFKRV